MGGRVLAVGRTPEILSAPPSDMLRRPASMGVAWSMGCNRFRSNHLFTWEVVDGGRGNDFYSAASLVFSICCTALCMHVASSCTARMLCFMHATSVAMRLET